MKGVTLEESKQLSDKHYDTHRRGLDFYNPDQDLNPLITIVGVGGIGSWAALCLSKMGFDSLILWDHDVVEPQNVGCQLYGTDDIGMPKVEALAQVIERTTDVRLTAYHKEYCIKEPQGIVIVAVDSMEARKQIFQTCKPLPSMEHKVPLFIDCRIGGELLLLYAVDPNNESAVMKYVNVSYPDSEARNLPCTGQNTAYIGMIAGAMIAKEVTGYCHQQHIFFHEIMFDIRANKIVEGREE